MAGPHELYFIRHGIAEERGDEWSDDTKRPLSARGMARMRKCARGFAAIGVKLDVVLTSPLVRARQTAEIVAGAFDSRPPIVHTHALVPGASFQSLLDELKKHSRRSRIALVGHETGLGEMAARMAGSRNPFPLRKGAICRIDVDDLPPSGAGTLKWFATPRILRQIRK